ncbi:unnamed protein product [Penicillium nalgiovense]|uniref:Cytochrome P450 n=2 Tax=Penicillium nalgiovense TaxID=60175 RepID=A0A9W4HD29_PENNA|nr:unnamed protein product [Penicillium nalgiovense]CAG7970267.1 unnamed protein product [Penicillium nalgiovense]CAG7972991.1 unnamed protein product [Penicillium nalgiovense]CAG7980241.1 unnamed protein product [Penicillium nalgiovense]CAG8039182.1 unnamed protein product [Penicillium nalgiovense]
MATEQWFYLDSTSGGLVLGVIAITFFLLEIRARQLNPSRLPVFNDRKWWEFGYGKATKRYIDDPEGLIKAGLKKGGDAFYLCTESHFRLILSPKYADVIGGDSRFDLGKFIGEVSISSYGAQFSVKYLPTFRTFIMEYRDLSQYRTLPWNPRFYRTLSRQSWHVRPQNLSIRFLKKLGWPWIVIGLKKQVYLPILNSSNIMTRRRYSNFKAEWHQVNLRYTASQIVAQMVCRGFLGDEDLCKNQEWLDLMYEFLETTFIAAHELRRWPMPMRRLASRFIPKCREVRVQLQEVEKYLKPLLDKEIGPDSQTNALEWVKEASKGCLYDFTTLQLTLALASLDTSSDLIAKAICDLSENPALVDDIRNEVVEIVGKEGLTKSSTQRLYLLDSAIKESQRLRPLGYSNMERLAKEKVVLPDGLIIPKGTAIMVSACHMMDSSVWPNGDKYDGYRFANLRKNAKGSLTSPYQLTSTSPDHMGFGHGKQACPGRHYAAMFLKVALCHIIMKYDFNVILPEEGYVQLRGHNILPHSNIKIDIRRRKEEISL